MVVVHEVLPVELMQHVLGMLDDTCDMIIAELGSLDCDVFEITDLLGVAETLKHHMPD